MPKNRLSGVVWVQFNLQQVSVYRHVWPSSTSKIWEGTMLAEWLARSLSVAPRLAFQTHFDKNTRSCPHKLTNSFRTLLITRPHDSFSVLREASVGITCVCYVPSSAARSEVNDHWGARLFYLKPPWLSGYGCKLHIDTRHVRRFRFCS